MKKLVSSLLGFFLMMSFAGAAQARSYATMPDSMEEGLELIALHQLALRQAELDRSGLSDLKDIVENIAAFVEGFKDSFLATYDTNGNGIIDLGPEWNGLQRSIRDIVMLIADSNLDGKVEPQELAGVIQTYVTALNEQVKDFVCTGIIVEAERLGYFLNFRPVLKHLYGQCTTF